MSSSIKTITNNGNQYFAYPLDLITNEIKFQKSVDVTSIGYIVSGGQIKEWKFFNFIHQDVTYLYGPLFEGITLEEALQEKPEEALQVIERLIQALILLDSKTDLTQEFALDSVYVLPDGFLFLPFEIINKILQNRTEQYLAEKYRVIHHPYEKSRTFTLASLLYRALCGHFPYEGSNTDEISHKMRNQKVISPKHYRLDLKEKIADYILNILKQKIIVKPEDMAVEIKQWLKTGLFTELSTDEKTKLGNKAAKEHAALNKSFQRAMFIERKRMVFVTGGLILLVIFGFTALIWNKISHVRVISGYTPEKVVETFYKSITKLDYETMMDCVYKSAGKKKIDEVVSFSVIVKQAESYHNKVGLIPADEWETNGKPEVVSPSFIWGVANLKISNIKAGNQPVYLVSYDKWQPPYDETQTNVVFHDEERVYLRQFKKDWLIVDVE